MKGSILSSFVLAAAFGMSSTTIAQTPPSSGTAATQGEQVTIVGCIQREADYRRAKDAGKGGVAGTGIGAANEFILANASASGTTGSKPGTQAPTGTTGASTTMDAYELTGPNETKAEQFVGRRVEITGRLKAAETGATGRPTGGATAGKPPTGVDVASQDLKLRELEVSTVREAAGTCPQK